MGRQNHEGVRLCLGEGLDLSRILRATRSWILTPRRTIHIGLRRLGKTPSVSSFPHLAFGFPSDFGFRISDFLCARGCRGMVVSLMPAHDWSRVTAGTFHDFHLAWIAELRRALNGGLLPPGYYAMAEQVAGDIIPDVLTLQQGGEEPEALRETFDVASGATVLSATEAPPRVSLTATTPEAIHLAVRRRRIAIRHTSGDRIVALLEIVSPGSKASRLMLRVFLEKAAAALQQGYHLLIIDLWPPGRWDPDGIHNALWALVGGGEDGRTGMDRPLTLAAYAVRESGLVTAYVEPVDVGAALPEMPLFLTADRYVPVPLEATCKAAWEGVPERWRKVIDPKA
jgi:hypothetical protein